MSNDASANKNRVLKSRVLELTEIQIKNSSNQESDMTFNHSAYGYFFRDPQSSGEKIRNEVFGAKSKSKAISVYKKLCDGPLPLSKYTLAFGKIAREMIKSADRRNISIEIKLSSATHKKYNSFYNVNSPGIKYTLISKNDSQSTKDVVISQKDVTIILHGDRYNLATLMQCSNFSHLSHLISDIDYRQYESFLKTRSRYFHPHRHIVQPIDAAIQGAFKNAPITPSKRNCTAPGHSGACFPTRDDFIREEKGVITQFKLREDMYDQVPYATKLAINMYTNYMADACTNGVNNLLRGLPITSVVLEDSTQTIESVIQQLNELIPIICFANCGISFVKEDDHIKYSKRFEELNHNKYKSIDDWKKYYQTLLVNKKTDEDELNKRLLSYDKSETHFLMGFVSTTATLPDATNGFAVYCCRSLFKQPQPFGKFIAPFSTKPAESEVLMYPSTEIMYQQVIREKMTDSSGSGQIQYDFLAKPVRSLKSRSVDKLEFIPAKPSFYFIILTLVDEAKSNNIDFDCDIISAIAASYHVYEVSAYLKQNQANVIGLESKKAKFFESSRDGMYYSMISVLFFKLYGKEAAKKLDEYGARHNIYSDTKLLKTYLLAFQYLSDNDFSKIEDHPSKNEVLALAAVIKDSSEVAEYTSIEELRKISVPMDNMDDHITHTSNIECSIRYLIHNFPPAYRNNNYKWKGVEGIYNDIFFDTTEYVLTDKEMHWCQNLFSDSKSLKQLMNDKKQFELSFVPISMYLDKMHHSKNNVTKQEWLMACKSLYHAVCQSVITEQPVSDFLESFFCFMSQQHQELTLDLLDTINSNYKQWEDKSFKKNNNVSDANGTPNFQSYRDVNQNAINNETNDKEKISPAIQMDNDNDEHSFLFLDDDESDSDDENTLIIEIDDDSEEENADENILHANDQQEENIYEKAIKVLKVSAKSNAKQINSTHKNKSLQIIEKIVKKNGYVKSESQANVRL